MAIEKKSIGRTPAGEEVVNYTIRSAYGSVTVSSLGASIQSILVPDRDGRLVDVALGFDSVDKMLEQNMYAGATIGRCANRLEKGILEIGGRTWQLACNDGENHLHGGPGGFHSRNWEANAQGNRVVFRRTSPDGEENYPGTMEVSVAFSFDDDGELAIEYEAVSDKETVCNLTNHVYLNLSGHGSGRIDNHYAMIGSGAITPNKEGGLPSGTVMQVEGTAFDFRQFRQIGDGIDSKEEQVRLCGGYDHNFILPENNDGSLPVAEVYSPDTGISMQVYTDLPGVQFYTGNFMDSSLPQGKDGASYGYRGGFCMETQYWPNAVVNKHFPSPVLKAGDRFRSSTIYAFGKRFS